MNYSETLFSFKHKEGAGTEEELPTLSSRALGLRFILSEVEVLSKADPGRQVVSIFVVGGLPSCFPNKLPIPGKDTVGYEIIINLVIGGPKYIPQIGRAHV